MNFYTSATEIDDTTLEGKLLVAAIAQLSSELSKTPDQVLRELSEAVVQIYKGQKPY